MLIAFDGKGGNYGGELIVAKSFESRGGVKICAEGECQGESEIVITALRVVEIAGFERKRAKPIR